MQKQILICQSLFCLCILAFACNNNGDTRAEATAKALKDSLEAVKVLDTVSHMHDVVERKKMIEGNVEGHRKLSTWIAGKPDRQSYYWVAVGEDSGNTESRLHFNFHIYPDSMRIVFYDILNQKEIPMEEWRARNK